MSRELPAELAASIEAPVVRPFYALRIELPDPVYAWTGVGTLAFDDADGNPREWTGAGQFGSIEPIEEASDGSATGVRATLFGAPAEFRDDIAEQAERGALFEVYVGAVDETFQEIVAVELLWKGRLDDYRIVDAGDSIDVQVTGESRGIDQRRPAIKRFTDEYQQRRHPGDRFFEYVPQMQEIEILWAQAEPKNAAAPGGGGVGGLIEWVVRTVHR